MDFGPMTGTIQLRSPVYTIPPYAEAENCLFYTYNGPDLYFTKGISYQNPMFGHHADIDVGREASPMTYVRWAQAVKRPWILNGIPS